MINILLRWRKSHMPLCSKELAAGVYFSL